VRGLGVIYAIAFLSLAVQVRGLIGDQGILPLRRFLPFVHEALGARAFYRVPTLFWLGHSDFALIAAASIGAVLACILVAGFAPRIVLAMLWLLYLSLSVAGQVFLQFQWDALLLEAGLISIVYAPRGLRPDWRVEPQPVARMLVWWLCFRLMFLSGITKLLSGDPTWRNLTALEYHYWTQPIPDPVAWFAAALPDIVQRLSVALMFVQEVGAPLLILVPTRSPVPRRVAAALLAALQLAIMFTGNYGFFNLLSLLLCLGLLDDRAIRWIVPSPLRHTGHRRRGARVEMQSDAGSAAPGSSAQSETRPRGGDDRVRARRFVPVVAMVMIVFGAAAFAREMIATTGRAVPRWIDALLAPVAPFSSFNGYGLFRVMTTERPEIIVERSMDGESWQAVSFRYKPGDVSRPPPFVAPYMPRLDWQMWFAALDPQSASGWLLPFLARLVDGSAPVADLLADDSTARNPPRFVRLALYRYRFTTPEQRRADGSWWQREFEGYLTGPLSRDELRPYLDR
jgi:lipase maturation factor 1